MTFSLPEGLHAIPLPLEPAERASAVADLVREVFAEGSPELWAVWSSIYRHIADDLVQAGIAFTGIGLYDLGEDGVGHCALTVGAMAAGHSDAEVIAQGLREFYGRRALHDVTWLDLPCGPAVSVNTVRDIVIDGAWTADGGDATLTTGQIQVYVPFPEAPWAAVFTLETAAVGHLEDFGAIMGSIVASVAFPDDDA